MRLFDLSQHQIPAIIRLISKDDKIVLRQDAVYLMNTDLLQQLPCPVYCLAIDAAVRGVMISEPFTALNDSQWLELVLQAKQQL